MLILVLPIMLDVFKARMLPKADKDQVYLWIDMPRDNTIAQTNLIHDDIQKFFFAS
jgi:multidrug efflux pump subunit AcrB